MSKKLLHAGFLFAFSSSLKMEATCFSETSVAFQRTARRYTGKDRTFFSYHNMNSSFHIIKIIDTRRMERAGRGNEKCLQELQFSMSLIRQYVITSKIFIGIHLRCGHVVAYIISKSVYECDMRRFCTLLACPTLSDSSNCRQALPQPYYCSRIRIGIELGNRLLSINSVGFYKEGEIFQMLCGVQETLACNCSITGDAWLSDIHASAESTVGYNHFKNKSFKLQEVRCLHLLLYHFFLHPAKVFSSQIF
jgi:hypothetical protein